jgi:hypothetical protein
MATAQSEVVAGCGSSGSTDVVAAVLVVADETVATHGRMGV